MWFYSIWEKSVSLKEFIMACFKSNFQSGINLWELCTFRGSQFSSQWETVVAEGSRCVVLNTERVNRSTINSGAMQLHCRVNKCMCLNTHVCITQEDASNHKHKHNMCMHVADMPSVTCRQWRSHQLSLTLIVYLLALGYLWVCCSLDSRLKMECDPDRSFNCELTQSNILLVLFRDRFRQDL